jgi:hypothetical protein
MGYQPFDYLVSGQDTELASGNPRSPPTFGGRSGELEIGPTGGRSWLLAGVRLLATDRGSRRDPRRPRVRFRLVAGPHLDGQARPSANQICPLTWYGTSSADLRTGGGELAGQGARSLEMEASGVLSDLAALTPPFLVAAAFLIAVGAFVRHEMRAAKKHPTEQGDEVDEPSATGQIGDRGSGSAP